MLGPGQIQSDGGLQGIGQGLTPLLATRNTVSESTTLPLSALQAQISHEILVERLIKTTLHEWTDRRPHELLDCSYSHSDLTRRQSDAIIERIQLPLNWLLLFITPSTMKMTQ